jgi:hypothetical protein
MQFDIDVSGEDIFSKDYTICIANKDGIIKGFKFDSDIISILSARYGQGLYRYKKSKKQRAVFKVRVYSIVIYYLFKSLKIKEPICLHVCRDFNGREQDVKSNLKYFLNELLKLNITELSFMKLSRDSNAHQYAYLMKKDLKNKLETYINISVRQIEKFLKK